MRSVATIILGGGRGTRLDPLTRNRSKPAVPIGGKYRLIDIPISNCLHSGLNRISVLTQFNSASLHRHIKRTYVFDAFSDGFVDILAAEQTQQSLSWYQGTADAVRQQLGQVLGGGMSEVLVLSGDHLYRMDYRRLIETHREQQADLTVGAVAVDREAAPQFGIFHTDVDGHIMGFYEKPQSDGALDLLRQRGSDGAPEDRYLASMGIYVFKPEVLDEVLGHEGRDDFGHHVIPAAIESHHVHAFGFDGYWEDIGTIAAYFRANLALTAPEPPFCFHEAGGAVFTHHRHLAPARIDGCRIDRSMVGDGAVLRRATLSDCLIGIRTVVAAGAQLAETITLGADYYETAEDRARNRERAVPDLGVGEDAEVRRAIIDRNARIGRGARIVNSRGVDREDGDGYAVRDGIVVILKDAVIPPGTVI